MDVHFKSSYEYVVWQYQPQHGTLAFGYFDKAQRLWPVFWQHSALGQMVDVKAHAVYPGNCSVLVDKRSPSSKALPASHFR